MDTKKIRILRDWKRVSQFSYCSPEKPDGGYKNTALAVYFSVDFLSRIYGHRNENCDDRLGVSAI